MGSSHNDRNRAVDLESGSSENNRGYGTMIENDSREYQTSAFTELKDHWNTGRHSIV